MNKLFITYISIAILLFLAIFGIFFKSVVLNSPDITTEVKDNCNVLEENGPASQKINILFLSNEKVAKQLKENLFSIEPFLSNKDKFNTYYITEDTYSPVCELYNNMAVFCYSKGLLENTKICPRDYIIAVKEESSSIRSSSYMNVISLNINNMENVFAHEFGHIFGKLADEYIPATVPKKSKNCALECSAFEQITSQCFQGCSNNDRFRSIENGLMKTLTSNDFGEFNEQLIQEEIDSITQKRNTITGNVIYEQEFCDEQHYILTTGTINSGQISFEDTIIERGCISSMGSGDYSLRVLGEESYEYLQGDFDPSLIYAEFQEIGSEGITGDYLQYEGEFYIQTPLIYGARTLEIKDFDDNILAQLEINFDEEIKLLGEEYEIPCKK